MFYNYEDKIININMAACIEKHNEKNRIVFWVAEAGTYEHVDYRSSRIRDEEFDKILAYMQYKRVIVGSDIE